MRMAATIALALFAVLSPAPARSQQTPPPPEGCKERLPTDRTTLDLRGADVGTTVRLLAEQYRISLIVTPDVTGLVTVTLYQVPVRDAFDALIRTAALVCLVRDDILLVMPGERLRREAETARKEQEELRKADQAAREQQRKEQEELRKAEQAAREQQVGVPVAVRGIVKFPGGVFAIVNDQIVKVGDVVDGQQVEEIGDEGIVLREPGRGSRLVPVPAFGGAPAARR
jgi:hypothetical protein